MTPELIVIFVLWGIVNLQFGRQYERWDMQRQQKEIIKAINRANNKEDKTHE